MRPDRLLAVLVAVSAVALGATGTAGSSPASPPAARPIAAQLAAADTALVTLQVANRAEAQALIGAGTDLPVRALADGAYRVDMVVTGAKLATLLSRGAKLVRVIQREGDGATRYAESVRAAEARRAAGLTSAKAGLAPGGAAMAATDTLHFQKGYWWTSKGQRFVAVQVTTTATEDPDVQITVTWRTADGRTGSYPLERFSDACEY